MSEYNLTLMTDLYQLTMMQGYFLNKMNHEAVFDLFYRKNAAQSAYSIMAGLEQAVQYIQNLKFSDSDIDYLRSLKIFTEEFLDYLKHFEFTGDIYSVAEGTPVFPGEPIVRVKAPMMQAQLIETALLTIIGHQTLIATKASRVCHAAGSGEKVLEFGLRRAQGPDAGLYGARAAVIGGCAATSNVLAGKLFDIPVRGTHAHSWVMCFENELEAFKAYASVYPDDCMLLVDTYDTLNSGIPNAIKVLSELKSKGHKPVGIRLDSGDLAYLSKQARKMLDEAGLEDAKIFASGDLDETIISDLRYQDAKIDVWGVGTKLITSEDKPSLGCVYKLAAMEKDGVLEPKIKLSDNIWKMTNPGMKKVVRLYDKYSGKALADLIMLDDEKINEDEPLTIFDPIETWKRKTLKNFYCKELLLPIVIRGELVYRLPSLSEIRKYAKKQLDTLWDEYKRLHNPHIYKVDLSDKLYELRKNMLNELKVDGNGAF